MGDNIIKTAASAVESVFTDSTAESDFTAPGQPEASAEQQLVLEVDFAGGDGQHGVDEVQRRGLACPRSAR